MHSLHLLLCLSYIQKLPTHFLQLILEEKEKGINNESQFLAGVTAIFLVYKNSFVLFRVKTQECYFPLFFS